MAWNLSGLIIILFLVNQSIAILLFGSNMSINLDTANRVLSSPKLCKGTISMGINKSLIERLNKTGQSIVEPCGTLEKMLS